MQVKDAHLHVELSSEQRRAPPPVLRDAALLTDVKAHGIPARVTGALVDLPVAASTHDVQSARAEYVVVMMAALLVRERGAGGGNL